MLNRRVHTITSGFIYIITLSKCYLAAWIRIYFQVPNVMVRSGAAPEAQECLHLPAARPLFYSPNLGVPKEPHFFSALTYSETDDYAFINYKCIAVSLSYNFL